MIERLCEYCDNPIVDPRKNQKYHPDCYRLSHNKQCSDRSHNKLLKQSPIMDKTCPICHNPYQTRASRDAATCKNINCKNIWQRRKRKEAWAKMPLEERKAINKEKYDRYSRYYKERSIGNVRSEAQTLECICPGCRKKHMHTFNPAWIGGARTPRVGCERYPHCVHSPADREDKAPITVYNSAYDSAWECSNSAII